MDGTPQLLTNIQFAEAKKGYDRDQVDNFLRELSVKIGELQDMLRQTAQRAEAAEARAAQATKAQAAAVAEAEEAKAQAARSGASRSSSDGGASDIEVASGVLALAQKTADAAVAEAESRGRDITAEARAKAAMIVTETQQEVERIKAEANEQVDAFRAERTRAVEREVQRLSLRRAGLEHDVELLDSYVTEHRRKLREGVEAIGKLLDDPTGMGLTPPARRSAGPDPVSADQAAASDEADAETSDAAPASVPDASTAPAPAPAATPAEGRDADRDDHGDASSSPSAAVASSVDPAPATGRAGLGDDGGEPTAEVGLVTIEDLAGSPRPSGPVSAPGPAAVASSSDAREQSPGAGSHDRGPGAMAATGTDGVAASASPNPNPNPSPSPTPVSVGNPLALAGEPAASEGETAKPVIDLTASLFETGKRAAGSSQPHSFDERAEHDEPDDDVEELEELDDDGPEPYLRIERPAPPAGAPGSPLGEPDADADAAMRAFFEQDLEELGKEQPKGGGRFLRRK